MDCVTSSHLPPVFNYLLAALPEQELRALEPRLQHVLLRPGRPLGAPSYEHVYFPTAGMVSVHSADRSGVITELAQVGCEGMVGLPALLGGHSMTLRAIVHAAGQGYRLRTADAQAIFAAGGHFQAVILRFALAFMTQVSQTAVCNMHHTVEQQLCRWLLLCLDRLQGDEIEITHEWIANVLGVRRQGVTEAVKRLERRGIIACRRGHISVLDRYALEKSACECYSITRQQTDGLLRGIADRQPGIQAADAATA